MRNDQLGRIMDGLGRIIGNDESAGIIRDELGRIIRDEMGRIWIMNWEG
jgi:hypothetical protein